MATIYIIILVDVFVLLYVVYVAEEIYITKRILEHGVEIEAVVLDHTKSIAIVKGTRRYLPVAGYLVGGMQFKAVATNHLKSPPSKGTICTAVLWGHIPNRVVLLDYPYRCGSKDSGPLWVLAFGSVVFTALMFCTL